MSAPRHCVLTPAELGAAARLAGCPLPFSVPDRGPDAGAAARARLVGRGLADRDGVLLAPLAAALATTAAAPVRLALAAAVRRDVEPVHLRSWHGATAALASRVSLVGADTVEVGWADPRWWVAECARLVRVPAGAPTGLPEVVSLPAGLLPAAARAYAAGRADLLPGLAAGATGRVRWGPRPATTAETQLLLGLLTAGCRGRARVVVAGPGPGHGLACWLLLGDAWHELRPGRAGRCVLRRREPDDVGRRTWPRVAALLGEAA